MDLLKTCPWCGTPVCQAHDLWGCTLVCPRCGREPAAGRPGARREAEERHAPRERHCVTYRDDDQRLRAA